MRMIIILKSYQNNKNVTVELPIDFGMIYGKPVKSFDEITYPYAKNFIWWFLRIFLHIYPLQRTWNCWRNMHFYRFLFNLEIILNLFKLSDFCIFFSLVVLHYWIPAHSPPPPPPPNGLRLCGRLRNLYKRGGRDRGVGGGRGVAKNSRAAAARECILRGLAARPFSCPLSQSSLSFSFIYSFFPLN